MTDVIKLTKEDKILINTSLNDAKLFLERFKCFHPFAFVMNKTSEILSLRQDYDREYPDSITLVNMYNDFIKMSLSKDSELTKGIICIDTILHREDGSKTDAIEFRIISEHQTKSIKLCYEIDSHGVVKFGEWC